MARELSPVYLRFREQHHAVARYFASGMTISLVARNTGYSRRRLHLLLNDPAFQELIAEYSKSLDEKIEESVDAYAELAIGNMFRAEAQIREKFELSEDEGELLPMRELLAIAKDRADRFGYGPKSLRVNVQVGFAEQLDRAIERSAKVKTIEAQPLPPKVEGPPRRRLVA